MGYHHENPTMVGDRLVKFDFLDCHLSLGDSVLFAKCSRDMAIGKL